MNPIKTIIIILTITFTSCENPEPQDLSLENNHIETIKTVSIDTFYIDENELNSDEWREYKTPSSQDSLSLELKLKAAISNDLIDDYYKNVYEKGKLIHADDSLMLSITDSLFTTNQESAFFYFVVFTKSMNDSDGYYSEILGLSAFDFISENAMILAQYFCESPRLNRSDLNNWVSSIYAEIRLSREGEETIAIDELELLVLENLKESQGNYVLVIEEIVEKIRFRHDENSCLD